MKVLENKNYQLTQFLLFSFSLLLPLYEQGNTWFLIALVILCVYHSWRLKLRNYLLDNLWFIIVPGLLLLVPILGLVNALNITVAFNEITRALSFVFLPFLFLVLHRTLPKRTIQIFFFGLTLGCLCAAIICWSNIFKILVENNEPLSNMFTWKKSNVYLTKIIDIHPPYLGSLMLTVIIYLFTTFVHYKCPSKSRVLAGIIILVLMLFLFNLVARNSLLFLILVSFGYMLYFRKWKIMFVGILFLVSFSFLIVENGNHYLQRKYYKMLDLSNEKIGDQRFNRFEASYNVFKQAPFFGVGSGNVDVLRLNEYKKMKDKQAIKHNLNSHNQYLEYLCTFGIIGLFSFVVVLAFLFKKAIIHQQYLLSILLCLFMFACLTESFLERELGIKYFSLIAGLIAFKGQKGRSNHNKFKL